MLSITSAYVSNGNYINTISEDTEWEYLINGDNLILGHRDIGGSWIFFGGWTSYSLVNSFQEKWKVRKVLTTF